MAGIPWTAAEIDFIKNNYEKMSCREMAEKMGRTHRAVEHRYNQLGLQRKQPEVGDTVEGTRLTILKKYMKKVGNQNKTFVWVRCSCVDKTEFEVKLASLVDGNTKSCKCLQREIQRERAIERNYKHGQSNNPDNELYVKWTRMKYNSGIEVCQQWQEYLDFEKWSLENGYEKGMHIYRLNEDDGIYEPCNCIWHPKGIAEERLYKTWSDMLTRCYNPKFKQYHNYGGRGISICMQWRKRYFVFKEWAINNGYKDDLTIERKNVNGNYEPDNCTWIPLSEQWKNKTNSK